MITIDIVNFRGCERAQVQCAPIALISGLNAAGKTSIAQAVGAALSGVTLPIAGLARGKVGGSVFVRSGAAEGSVEVSGDDGSASVTWPDAKLVMRGKPPTASAYAVGLQSIVDMAPRDRVRVLAEYLHADPTRDELAAALAEHGLGAPQVIETLWPSIERNGWDGAERERRDRGAQMKGQWRQVTTANWGSKVGAGFRPDLGYLVESDLVAAVAQAKNDRDRAIAAQAVSDAEREGAEAEARELSSRRERVDVLAARAANAESDFQKARAARQSLPAAEQARTVPCPYCAQPIKIERDVVEVRLERIGMQLDDKTLRDRRQAIATADGTLANRNDALLVARQQLAEARAAVDAAERAAERIANWPRAVETGTDLETATQALSRADKHLAEYRMKIEADRLHGMIEGNEIAIRLLAADGLRATKLERVIGVFVRSTLAGLSTASGWGMVEVDAEGNIAYAGRAYGLLSTSEQYRVRALLAAAMAQIDGSAMVIFDGADVLDLPSRSGLFELIRAIERPALVCMTMPRSRVPDLRKEGFGESYWLAGGVVELLGERIAA